MEKKNQTSHENMFRYTLRVKYKSFYLPQKNCAAADLITSALSNSASIPLRMGMAECIKNGYSYSGRISIMKIPCSPDSDRRYDSLEIG